MDVPLNKVRESLKELAVSLVEEVSFDKYVREQLDGILEDEIHSRMDRLDLKDDVVEWLNNNEDVLDVFLEENKKLIHQHISQILFSEAMVTEFLNKVTDKFLEKKEAALPQESGWWERTWEWVKKCFVNT